MSKSLWSPLDIAAGSKPATFSENHHRLQQFFIGAMSRCNASNNIELRQSSSVQSSSFSGHVLPNRRSFRISFFTSIRKRHPTPAWPASSSRARFSRLRPFCTFFLMAALSSSPSLFISSIRLIKSCRSTRFCFLHGLSFGGCIIHWGLFVPPMGRDLDATSRMSGVHFKTECPQTLEQFSMSFFLKQSQHQ